MLEMVDVWKEYEMGSSPFEALKAVSLLIEDKEFVTISGPSGSGKSTLMNLLGGLDRPSRGRIYYNSCDISNFSDKEMARFRNKKIGFVFQKPNLQGNLTALQNVEMPLFYARMPAPERKKKAVWALSEVGLLDRIHHLPSQLSGGQCQRVGIARAIVMHPDILLADEPTGNLDYENEDRIISYLRGMNHKGYTVVMITHNRGLSDRSDRNIVIKNGEIFADIRK